MRIILTGATSFSGLWFARALRSAGHELFFPVRGTSVEGYSSAKRDRLVELAECGSIAWGLSFGGQEFDAWIKELRQVDILCHHAAQVTRHKEAEFDILGAVGSNVQGFPLVVSSLQAVGCSAVIYSGSYYEHGEGEGDSPLYALSPYAVSKTLSWEVLHYYSIAGGMRVGKFVMPNPFGPFEEKGFTYAMLRAWMRAELIVVETPLYVRDNIHISLLARAYSHFCKNIMFATNSTVRLSPSGYRESQGDFAHRVQREMRRRTGFACKLRLAEQQNFREPKVRVNRDPAGEWWVGWSENAAWDAYAEFWDSRKGPFHFNIDLDQR